MSNNTEVRDRNAEFRQALVATANLAPYLRRRPPLKLVVASFAAFALAGALTGGAIATVNKVDPTIVLAQTSAKDAAQSYLEMQDGILLGKPITRTAEGTQQIELGVKPADATDLVEGFVCIDPGKFVNLLDRKKYEVYPECTGGAGAGSISVTGHGPHLVTIQTSKSASFTIWLSWAKIPKLLASLGQKQEMSDGLVTRDEVLAAVNRYAGCLDRSGNSIGVIAASVVPSYSVSDLAVSSGAEHRCYVTEFQNVDVKWQLELEAGELGQASIAACKTSGNRGLGTRTGAIATPEGVLPDLTNCPWIG